MNLLSLRIMQSAMERRFLTPCVNVDCLPGKAFADSHGYTQAVIKSYLHLSTSYIVPDNKKKKKPIDCKMIPEKSTLVVHGDTNFICVCVFVSCSKPKANTKSSSHALVSDRFIFQKASETVTDYITNEGRCDFLRHFLNHNDPASLNT